MAPLESQAQRRRLERQTDRGLAMTQMTRRDTLRLGLGGLFGASFIEALRLRASADAAGKAQANSCILIWLDGGPTHYETFDPKPSAPAEYRGEFNAIAT